MSEIKRGLAEVKTCSLSRCPLLSDLFLDDLERADIDAHLVSQFFEMLFHVETDGLYEGQHTCILFNLDLVALGKEKDCSSHQLNFNMVSEEVLEIEHESEGLLLVQIPQGIFKL